MIAMNTCTQSSDYPPAAVKAEAVTWFTVPGGWRICYRCTIKSVQDFC